MAGAPGSLALAPPGAPPLTFLSVDGACYRISSSDTSQGARHRRFLALMVDAPGSPAPAPPGGRHRRFLALMVGAPEYPAPTPPRGFTVDVS
jgi:hypothetical protein